LQKKSGYDVCREIKSYESLAKIPIVLVWSGFMELDQVRYKNSGANAALEKPFDTQRLRQIVQSLVPKTQTQPLSSHLKFPKLPDFDDGPPKTAPGVYPTPPPVSPAIDLGSASSQTASPVKNSPKKDNTGSWSMDNFAPIEPVENLDSESLDADLDSDSEQFTPLQLPPEVPLKKISAPPVITAAPADESDDNQWFQKTLSKYKLDPSRQQEEDRSIKIQPPEITKTSPFSGAHGTATGIKPVPPVLFTEHDEVTPLELELDLGEAAKEVAPVIPQLNEKQLEAIIRAQAKDVIEKVVWQVVPEIATRIIERELERLLKERQSQ